MKSEYRKGSQTAANLNCHLVWGTKYRHQVLSRSFNYAAENY